MNYLVTLEEALPHLRANAEDNVEIYSKISQASDIVIDYVTDPERHSWTDETVPPRAKAATLLVLTALWTGEDEPLNHAVRALLRRLRDPSLA